MDAETKLWQRQLEQATSCDGPAGAALDAETADLREGWSALGRLIEAADADFDGQALLVQVSMARRSDRHRWLGVAALAASLLLAVSAAWLWSRSGQQPATPSAPDVAHSTSPQQSPATKSAAPTTNGELPWDDAWDERLAQVDQSFVSLRSWSDLGDTSLQIVDEQLRQINQEMKTEL